jgi:hypothetical protein
MLPPFIRVLLVVMLIAACGGTASAQSRRSQNETVYQSHVADVPLQPFLTDRRTASSSSVQVAYYTRPLPRLQRTEDEDNDSQLSSAGAEVGGSHPMVPGNRAVLHHGVAYAPSNAPDRVKNAVGPTFGEAVTAHFAITDTIVPERFRMPCTMPVHSISHLPPTS